MGHGEQFLQSFINYEKNGVPKGAGVDGEDGFDLVRQCPMLFIPNCDETAHDDRFVDGHAV